MENLHEYICQQAIAHAQKPSMPGPPPPASRYIGQRRLKAGPPDEPMVRVMFHCVSPPNSESRHVLLHLRPSVPEEDLAKKLDEIFEIHSNAGVITRTMPEFMPGFNPITVPDKGTILSSNLLYIVLHTLTDRSVQLGRDVRVARIHQGWLYGGGGRPC